MIQDGALRQPQHWAGHRKWWKTFSPNHHPPGKEVGAEDEWWVKALPGWKDEVLVGCGGAGPWELLLVCEVGSILRDWALNLLELTDANAI